MARIRRSSELGKRDQRERLERRAEPHWHIIEPGLALGYRKPAEGAGAWIVRRYDPARRRHAESRVGTADDFRDADGVQVLDFGQAQRKILAESQERALKASGKLYTVEDAVNDYLEFMRQHRKSADDAEAKLNTYVVPRLGERRVAELTPADFSAWLSWALKRQRQHKPKTRPAAKKRNFKTPRPVKVEPLPKQVDKAEALRRRKSTVNRVVNSLKACLNHARSNGKVASDEAWSQLQRYRGADSSRIRWLTVEEATRLQNAAGAELRPLILAAMLTGCRKGELLKLRTADFDSHTRTLLIVNSKNSKTRRVYLNKDGVALFETVTAGKAADEPLFGSEWYPMKLKRALGAAYAAAKVAPVKFHELRHTYASHLVQKGEPLLNVAALLGHSDTRTVAKHYAHLAPSHLHATVAKLPSFGALPTSNVEKLKPKAAR